MEVGPAVGDDELDYPRHDEQAESREPRPKTQHEHDWQHDLGDTGEVGDKKQHGDAIDGSPDTTLEIPLQQKGGGRAQRQYTDPTVDASPEAVTGQHEANHRRNAPRRDADSGLGKTPTGSFPARNTCR